MFNYKLFVKNESNFEIINPISLYEHVLRKAKVKIKSKKDIPVGYVYLVTDGHDLLSVKNIEGEDFLYYFCTPSKISFLKPKKEVIFYENRFSIYKELKQLFNIHSSRPINQIARVIDLQLAIRAADSIVIPKILFIENIDLVKFQPCKDGYTVSAIPILDAIGDKQLMLNKQSYISKFKFNKLSEYLIGSIMIGNIVVPEKNTNGSFPID